MYSTFTDIILLISVLKGSCEGLLDNKSESSVLEENSLFNISNTTIKTLKDNYSELILTNQSSTLPTVNANTSLASEVDKPTTNTQNNDLSRIIVFIPQDREDNNLLLNNPELNFMKKIKNLVLSFLLFASQNHIDTDGNESSRIHERDIGDFFQKAKDTVIETSKKVINTTKEVVKTVEGNIKRIATRNATFLQDIKNETATDIHTCHEHCKSSTPISSNKTTINTLENTDTVHPMKDDTQNKTVKIKLSLINEYPTNKPIDRNTKYFFGEDTFDEIQVTATSQNRIKREKSRANTVKKLKRHISRKKCKQDGSGCNNNRVRKEAVGDPEHKTGNKSDVYKTNNTNKQNQDPFMYKDWLWQHLESVKNGSLKTNSTKDFLKMHHFLLNSGGTEKSATDVSEYFTIISTQPTLRYGNIQSNLTLLKRHKRIKRQVRPDIKQKRKRKRTKSSELAVTDQEVTLGEEYEEYREETSSTSSTSKSTTTSTSTSTTTSQIPTTITHSSESTSDTTPETQETTSATTEASSTTIKEMTTSSTSTIKNNFETEFHNLSEHQSTSEREEIETTEDSTTILTTNDKLNVNIGKQHKKSTESSDFDKNEHESKTTSSKRQVTIKTQKIQTDFEKEWNDGGGIRTKPLLLLVTIPSFIGIGVFILALCFLTRSGGWCCQLFEARRASQISITKETQEPSVSHRPLRR